MDNLSELRETIQDATTKQVSDHCYLDVDEVNAWLTESSCNFNIIHLNIRSLRNKQFEIRRYSRC